MIKPLPHSYPTKECIEVTILEAPSSPSSSSSSSSSHHEDISTRHPKVDIPSLTDEELWEPWFAFPSRPQMTLHRWAEGTKSQLDMFTHNLPSSPPTSLYPLFLTKCRSTLTSLKILVLGSILLIRGVNHGPQMGRTLFGRIIGDRYNDLMAFRNQNQAQAQAEVRSSVQGLFDDEEVIGRSVDEAKGLQMRGNEFFAQGKYEASLEHYGMAIIKLIPFDTASISPYVSQKTGFGDTEHSLLLSIALTSIRISQTLPLNYRSHTTIPGSRLYRLTKASCDYVSYSPISRVMSEEAEGAEEELAGRLESLGREIAEIPFDRDQPHQRERERDGRSVRDVRGAFESGYSH
nr:hypothetical protein I302_05903 [Kwoniella bestiolae CBS 10118]OCF24443.1 hypothetical protein I302_05903 [Kwoniella bestiolae CBS 10118]